MRKITGPKAGFNPQTGARPEMRPRQPVLSDQARTSAGAQRLVRRPPMPFENPQGPKNFPAPVNRAASHPYGLPAGNLLPKKAGARIEANIGAHGRTTPDMLSAVGEPRLPKGYNPIISDFPLTGGKGKR